MNTELFPKLMAEEFSKLAELGVMTTVFPDDILYREGASENLIYVVMTGELHLLKTVAGQECILASYRPGDFTGDVALLVGAGSEASLRPASRSTVLQIETREIPRLVADYPELGRMFLRTFAARTLELLSEDALSRAPTRSVSTPAALSQVNDRLLHPVTSEDHTISSHVTEQLPEESIEVVVYGDYQCPFTWQGQDILESLMSDESETPIRYTFRHFPQPEMHPLAELGAHAVEAAHLQGRFWEFHRELLRAHGRYIRESLVDLARKLGLDGHRFETSLESEWVHTRVREQKSRGEESGVEITPAIFLDGARYSGPLRKASLSSALLRIQQKHAAA